MAAGDSTYCKLIELQIRFNCYSNRTYLFTNLVDAKIINAIPTTSKAGQPKEITAINAIPATMPTLTLTTGLRISWPELNHAQGLAKVTTPHGKSKSAAHMLNSAAEPKDSQVSSQVPPEPPKPEPIAE